MPNVVLKDIAGYTSFLPLQYSESDTVNKFLSVFLDQVQELENANIDLDNGSTDIDTAIGYQLDIFGKLVGALREGRTDEEYREYIRLTIVVNTGSGRPEDILFFLNATTNATNIRYWEHYPASIYLYLEGEDAPSSTLPASVETILPAGVSLGFIGYSNNPLVFTPYDQEFVDNNLIIDVDNIPIITNESDNIVIKTASEGDNYQLGWLAERATYSVYDLVDDVGDTIVDDVGDTIGMMSEDLPIEVPIHGILAERI